MSIPKIVLLEDPTEWSIDTHRQVLDETRRARFTSLIDFTAANQRTPR
ncbi:hypothetical protein [Glutamicibacter sp. NPDC127525]